MKKLILFCAICGLPLALSGCSLGTVIDQFQPVEEQTANTQEHTAAARVYMDETTGILQNFNGSELTLSVDDDTRYTFDLSQATLECEGGIISGDEVSVIYEGQLSDTDTSSVKALKVVDEFNKKNPLKERTAHGQVQALTLNTITLKSKKGKTATYPITGAEQYYQNGIKSGSWVYLHFKGKFAQNNSTDTNVLDASHLKVLSISDIDPITVPELTPTPVPAADETVITEQKIYAVIQDVNLNQLTILPDNSDTPVTVDMSEIPAYFKGGIAQGSHVTVTYLPAVSDSAEAADTSNHSLTGATILGVTGENPDSTNDYHISFTVTGSVLGSTANTVTIQTTDGAIDTFRIENTSDSSTGGLEPGCSVCITFHPSVSKTTNIYTAIKIKDA